MDFELQKQLQNEQDKPIIVYDEQHVVIWHNKTAEELLGNSDGHKFEDVIAAYQPVIRPITVAGRKLKAAIFPTNCDCQDFAAIPADAPVAIKKAEYLITILGILQEKRTSVLMGAVVMFSLSLVFVSGRLIYKISNDSRFVDAIIHVLDETSDTVCPKIK